MGAYDEMTTPRVTDKEDIVTQKRKISKCVVDMGLSDDSLVEIVDNYYTDLEQWSNPPNIALRVGLLKVCKMLQQDSLDYSYLRLPVSVFVCS